MFWVESIEATRTFGGETNHAFVIAYFDHEMQSIGFDTSNLYDIIARELFESGEISSIPEYDYFEALKDSLLYWNGDNFQHELVMNKEYLRAKVR